MKWNVMKRGQDGTVISATKVDTFNTKQKAVRESNRKNQESDSKQYFIAPEKNDDIKQREDFLNKKLRDYPDHYERTYSNGYLSVYKCVEKRDNTGDTPANVYVYLTSTVHWTDAITITYNRTYEDKVFISYGSGGTHADDPEDVAEVMAVMFKQAQEEIKRLKEKN